MLRRALFALIVLITAGVATGVAHFGVGRHGAPAVSGLPQVTAVNLSGPMTYTNGSPSGTSIGNISVVMSSGSFTGSLSLKNGGSDSTGDPCDANNTTNFQIVAGVLELNTTLSGAYNVCVTATQGSSTLTEAFAVTGVGGSQSIASVPLSNNTFAPSSPSGTVVGVIGTPVMSPSSPTFTGSCCTLNGTDAASFQIVGSNFETSGSLCTSPPVTYHLNIRATQASASNTPFDQAETITCASQAIAGISLQATTFTAGVASVPVGAVMPTLTNGAPFTSALFTGTLSIVTSGLDSNGTTCTTNGNHFQILSASLQLAAASSSPPGVGSYPGVCVQASQAGYTSWIQAFTLTGAAAPANQIVLTNASGSNITNYKFQFGRPFVDGAITSGNCPIVNINGTPAAQSQFDVKNSWGDGSVRFGIGAVVIPTLVNNVATTLTFTSGSCNNTALSKAAMLAGGFNFDATETLLFPAAVLTGGATRLTTIANWNAVTSGGFNITINGTPLTITGLNFSAATSQSAVANIVQAAINTALGTPSAVQVFDLGGLQNFNDIFVLSVLGAGKTISAATPPGSGVDISGLLKWTSGTLLTNTVPATTTISARTMLNNGNYTLWTSGPVAQTIILADDSSSAAYDAGNDGSQAFRPRIYATFWSGDNSVSIRTAGEQNKSTQLEDMSYGVTIATGNVSPTTQAQLDLSGTGNAFGEGQTGLTTTQAKVATSGGIPNGALTVSGTLSGPALTVGQKYYFEDLNNALWCQFTYTNSTTLTIINGCNQHFGISTPTSISIGDPLLIGNPKWAWTQSSWIMPIGGSGTPDGSYWINDTPKSQQVNVDYSLAYLDYAREIPNYDASISLLGSTVTSKYAQWSPFFAVANLPYDADWDGGAPGIMTVSVGSGGASFFLGPMPDWQTYWLYTGAWQMRVMSLQHADQSSSYPNQIRETDATRKLVRGGSAGTGLGLPVSIAGRPGFQGQGGNTLNLSQLCQISGVYYGRNFCFGVTDNLPVIPGSAAINHGDPFVALPNDHLPMIWRVPAVLTGDPWYFNEETLVIASLEAGVVPYNGTPSNAPYTRGSNGTYCNMVDQFRGEAWYGHFLASTAFDLPDADPFKPYLQDCMNDTLAIWEGALGITGTVYDGTNAKTWALTLKDPESSAGTGGSTLSLNAIPTLHEWDDFYDSSAVANTFEKRGVWKPGNVLGLYDPWMFHYNMFARGREVELGFAAGPLQSYMAQVYLNWTENSAYSPYLFDQYGSPVEQTASAGGGFYSTWNALMAEYTPQWLTGVGWNMSVTSMVWDSGNGGEVTVATATPNAVDVGSALIVSGATNTGTGGNADVNFACNLTFAPVFPNCLIVATVIDSQHFTALLPAASGVIGTIAGTITSTIAPGLGGNAAQIWAIDTTTASDGGRYLWAMAGNATNTDNAVGAPWGAWWGVNAHNQIPNWTSDTHWDIVPRTDLNVLPTQPTSTPP